jgi:hypothetical protein
MAKKENSASNPDDSGPYRITQLSKALNMHSASFYGPDACPMQDRDAEPLKNVLTYKK